MQRGPVARCLSPHPTHRSRFAPQSDCQVHTAPTAALYAARGRGSDPDKPADFTDLV